MFCARHCLTTGGLALAVLGLIAAPARAQTSPVFVFTETPPQATTPKARVDVGTALPDRGLSLVQDGRFDPGVAVDFGVGHALAIRSVSSTVDLWDRGRSVANFQQIEVLRSWRGGQSWALAYGGGVRQEWGRAQTLVARMAASLALGSSTIAGGVVLEKALSRGRDSADVVTTLGITRALTSRVAFGIEGVGRDLEGFWQRNETDGGARLLVGPSLHLTSRSARWRASFIGGPMATSTSTLNPGLDQVAALSGRFAVLASVTYTSGDR